MKKTAMLALSMTSTLAGCAPEAGETDDTAAAELDLGIAAGPNVRVSAGMTMSAGDQPAAAASPALPGHLLIASHHYPPGARSPSRGRRDTRCRSTAARASSSAGWCPG